MKHVFDVPDGLGDRVREALEQCEPLTDGGLADVLGEVAEMLSQDAYLELSPALVRCLLVGPWATGWDLVDQPLSLHQQDEEGWVVVGCPSYWDSDESGEPIPDGVWVDTGGTVWYSAPMSEEAVERMHNPRDEYPVVLLEHPEKPTEEDSARLHDLIDSAPDGAIFLSVAADPYAD